MIPRRWMLLAFALAGCSDAKLGAFRMPREMENLRGRLLPFLEGHPIAESRTFLRDQGFQCDAPQPSAADAHVHRCHATTPDAGWSRWTLVLIERSGRVADLQVR